VNWSAPIPSTSSSRCAASSIRVDSGTHSPPVSSRTRTRACSVVDPPPRRLGRSQAGERVTSNRRGPAENSHTTFGATPGSAWSLRNRQPCARLPGTHP
jgi:hypothetical protein